MKDSTNKVEFICFWQTGVSNLVKVEVNIELNFGDVYLSQAVSVSKISHVLIPKAGLNFEAPSSFDIYVPMGERFLKVIAAGQMIDRVRVERYLEKKADVLQIESIAIERFLDEKFFSLFESTSRHLDAEIKFQELVRCFELCLLDLRLVRFHADKFMRLNMVIESLFEVFKKRDLRAVLLKVSHENIENTFTRRSILGAFLAIAMVFEQGDTTKIMFSSLMLGALMRDFECATFDDMDPHIQVYTQTQAQGDALTAEPLTTDAIAQFKLHPQDIIKRLHDFKMADDLVDNIILQHHEHPSGTGFPRGLKRFETYMPAQFVWLADWLINVLYEAKQKNLGPSEVAALIKDQIPSEQKKSLPFVIRVLSQCYGAQINLGLVS